MSQHIVEQEEKKYVFGWDQMLMSFYLQVHDLVKDEDDEDRIPVWLGINIATFARLFPLVIALAVIELVPGELL